MERERILSVPGTIKVERSERANAQVQVVSDLIDKSGINKKAADELIYELSKLLLLTEMDCVMAGYAMGLEALNDNGRKTRKGKWLI